MSARRALLVALRRRAGRRTEADHPPEFWGRVGPYEAVTREGVLYLVSPEATHPSRSVTSDAWPA